MLSTAKAEECELRLPVELSDWCKEEADSLPLFEEPHCGASCAVPCFSADFVGSETSGGSSHAEGLPFFGTTFDADLPCSPALQYAPSDAMTPTPPVSLHSGAAAIPESFLLLGGACPEAELLLNKPGLSAAFLLDVFASDAMLGSKSTTLCDPASGLEGTSSAYLFPLDVEDGNEEYSPLEPATWADAGTMPARQCLLPQSSGSQTLDNSSASRFDAEFLGFYDGSFNDEAVTAAIGSPRSSAGRMHGAYGTPKPRTASTYSMRGRQRSNRAIFRDGGASSSSNKSSRIKRRANAYGEAEATGEAETAPAAKQQKVGGPDAFGRTPSRGARKERGSRPGRGAGPIKSAEGAVSKEGGSSSTDEEGNRRRKQHNPWDLEETEALITGVEHCGGGRWADIKKLGFKVIDRRSAVDLKDKWRNLIRVALMPQSAARSKCDKRREVPWELLDRVRAVASATSASKAAATAAAAAAAPAVAAAESITAGTAAEFDVGADSSSEML